MAAPSVLPPSRYDNRRHARRSPKSDPCRDWRKAYSADRRRATPETEPPRRPLSNERPLAPQWR